MLKYYLNHNLIIIRKECWDELNKKAQEVLKS